MKLGEYIDLRSQQHSSIPSLVAAGVERVENDTAAVTSLTVSTAFYNSRWGQNLSFLAPAGFTFAARGEGTAHTVSSGGILPQILTPIICARR